MKLNIANPQTGAQVKVEIDDDRKLAALWDRRLAQEINGEQLGPEFNGYVFKITGGCDKQGFPMKQGVAVAHRVRLLLGREPGFWRPNRDGAFRRRSVRGCIVAQDIASLNLVVVKQGDNVLPGLDRVLPRRLGPKRATKIRKLFNLTKKDDVRKYVVRRELPVVPREGKKDKKFKPKAPKIQRLVTPRRLQHKRHQLALRKRWTLKSKEEAAQYAKLLATRRAEEKKKSEKKSEKKTAEKPAAAAAADAKAKPAAGKGGKAKAAPSSKPAAVPVAKVAAATAPKKAAKKAAAKPAAAPAAAPAPKPAAAAAAAPKPAAAAAPKPKAAGKKGKGGKKQ